MKNWIKQAVISIKICRFSLMQIITKNLAQQGYKLNQKMEQLSNFKLQQTKLSKIVPVTFAQKIVLKRYPTVKNKALKQIFFQISD